ncbi:MAG: SH3 domain-containing protein [Candidatus Omnitrophica bacterium]|nr:SH3 domain-containing protein [Candidatus Omnitrophota bacterium]
MKKAILAVLLLFIYVPFYTQEAYCRQDAQVNSPRALFYRSNINYQDGKYALAIEGYEDIISSGWESGNLYYNLGNSYFKKGDIGLAIVNYYRAMSFIPNDSDLRSNYRFALQTLKIEQKPFGGRFQKTLSALFGHMTIDSVTILLSLLYIATVVFFILGLFLERLKRFNWFFAGIMAVLFILSAYALAEKISYKDRFAVAVSKETEARFEPLPNATAYFKIEEGDRVEIIEENPGWYKVRRFDNKTGWAEKRSFVKLNQ